MADLKRDVVKYVRDKAKSNYAKGTECRICGDSEELDFHHFNSVTELLENWLRDNKIRIDSSEDIINVRDEFIGLHNEELYNAVATLCHTHHLKLHSIYGKRPTLNTAPKQARWVEKQRVKNGLV